MGQQTAQVINLDGGLDLTSTHYMLQQAPGTASILVNYEPSIEGGYRRINGYQKFGSGLVTGSPNTILATYPYADGVVAVAGSGIYFSTNGDAWLQVNRDTYTAGTGTVEVALSGTYIQVNGTGTAFTTEYEVGGHIRIAGNIRKIAAIISDTDMVLDSEISGGVSAGATAYYNGTLTLSGSVISRNTQGFSEIAWLEEDGEYRSLSIVDRNGNANIGYFKITGSGASRKYYYDDLDEDFAAPLAPRHAAILSRRLIVANRDSEKSTVFWSDRFDNQRFDGASAGSVTLVEPIIEIKPFKDRLIIFCRNSIHQLVNIDTPEATQVLEITSNTGAAVEGSVQELGGDLVFLSHDGIRTLSATDQYGDVTLGVISRKIDPYIKEILFAVSGNNFCSTVSRYKNQYRLFYNASSGSGLGLIATYKLGSNGQLGWQWSKTQDMAPSCISSITNNFIPDDEQERIYHGGYDGYVYRHDVGNTFDGTIITSKLKLNEIDYGDIGLKKTLHYVRLFGNVEGEMGDIDMKITYDFDSQETHQPDQYPITTIDSVAIYGDAIFGTSKFGGVARFSERILVDGSGFSNSFLFSSYNSSAPYSINSLYVDYRIGAKQ